MENCKICKRGRVYKSGFCLSCFNKTFPVCPGEDEANRANEAGIYAGETDYSE